MSILRDTELRSPLVMAGAGSVGFVALLWLIEFVDALADHRSGQYGVHPRSDEGLLGIVVAPLLHGGWLHLEANTVPALVLLVLVLVSGLARGLKATAVIWLVGGAVQHQPPRCLGADLRLAGGVPAGRSDGRALRGVIRGGVSRRGEVFSRSLTG